MGAYERKKRKLSPHPHLPPKGEGVNTKIPAPTFAGQALRGNDEPVYFSVPQPRY